MNFNLVRSQKTTPIHIDILITLRHLRIGVSFPAKTTTAPCVERLTAARNYHPVRSLIYPQYGWFLGLTFIKRLYRFNTTIQNLAQGHSWMFLPTTCFPNLLAHRKVEEPCRHSVFSNRCVQFHVKLSAMSTGSAHRWTSK
jgi:hypothetical protein